MTDLREIILAALGNHEEPTWPTLDILDFVLTMAEETSDDEMAVAAVARYPLEDRRVFASESARFAVVSYFAKSDDATVRAEVATNLNTPVSLLLELASDQSPRVRRLLAHHPSITTGILADLANDSSVTVREAVAANEKTPTDVLTVLAKSSSVKIKRAVHGNGNVDPFVQMELMIDLA